MGGCHFIHCCWQFSSHHSCSSRVGTHSELMDQALYPWLRMLYHTLPDFENKFKTFWPGRLGSCDGLAACTSLAHWNGSIWRPIIFCLLHVKLQFSPTLDFYTLLYALLCFYLFFPHDDMTKAFNFFNISSLFLQIKGLD